jgi:radical SAM superfamily enzyme YgiQ (UPF0313 family)
MMHLLFRRDCLALTSMIHGQNAYCAIVKNIASLRESHVYAHPDRYRRAVADINRVLEVSARAQGVTVGLANYQDSSLSPLRSSDLIRAAETFEENPFYPYFSDRLYELIGRAQPTLIGFSLNYLSQALCTFAMAGFIRKRFPGIKIVLGGGLVTSWLRRPGWISPFDGLIDHLIAGPGEYPLLSLLGIEGEKDCLPVPVLATCRQVLSPGTVLPYGLKSGCY